MTENVDVAVVDDDDDDDDDILRVLASSELENG